MENKAQLHWILQYSQKSYKYIKILVSKMWARALSYSVY